MMAQLTVRQWTAAKQGHAAEENDDACRVDRIEDGGPQAFLVAVSDGVTEAIYAGAWARVLVQSAQPDWAERTPEELEEVLGPVRRGYSPLPRADGDRVPWYVRQKFQSQGSQATLLVASAKESLLEPGTVEVHAGAAGDSCLIILRIGSDGYDYLCFPIDRSEDFGGNPALVGSQVRGAVPYLRLRTKLRDADIMLACTDAVAKWIMECFETGAAASVLSEMLRLVDQPHTGDAAPGRKPPAPEAAPRDALDTGRWWQFVRNAFGATNQPGRPGGNEGALEAFDPQPPWSFADFVQSRRSGGSPRMRNDDSTLVICVFGNAAEVLREHQAAARRLPVRRECREDVPPPGAP